MIEIQQIFDNIIEPQSAKKTIQEWAHFFGVNEKEMLHTVNQFIDQGDLALSRKGKLVNPQELGLFKGSIFINTKGHGYVSIEGNEEDTFISASYIKDAMHKDIVQIQVKLDHGEKFTSVVRIIERHTTTMVGTITLSKRGWDFFPLDIKLQKRYPIIIPKNLKVKSLDMIIARINSYQPLKFTAESVLGSSKKVGMDILGLLIEHKVPIDFSTQTLKEVERVNEKVPCEVGRIDYRQNFVVTIDGEDAKDLDDAISLQGDPKGIRLHVHIADVSYYVVEYLLYFYHKSP